jgi:plasmid stabilization system protein ParE
VSRYKLTRKAEADLAALVRSSAERFGPDQALRFLEQVENRIQALARHDFEGPEVTIPARTERVRRWPVPPYWLYYDRVGGVLRVLRVYHGAQKPL